MIADCRLEADGLRTQADRYRALAASVTSLGREEDELVVAFGEALDRGLLDETIAIERDCCPFFRISVEDGPVVRVGVESPDQLGALDAIEHAFTA